MKAAKADYYDPKLKGKSDGQGMDNLPRIITPPSGKSSQKASSSVTAVQKELTQLRPDLSGSDFFKQAREKRVSQSTNRSTSQSASRLVNQLVDWSTSQSIDQSTILGRPKAFYLTQKQDEDLDVAVQKLNRKLGERINQKIDRSTLIRLLLEESDITSERTMDRLASRLVSQLISRLTG